jgi:hypothetical protein
MTLVPTFNGYGISEFQLTIPQWGAWVLDVRLAGDPQLTQGAPFTFIAGDSTFTGEVRSIGSFSGRWRVLCGPTGYARLSGKGLPRFLSPATLSQVATAICAPSPVTFLAPDQGLRSATLPATLTGWQLLAFYLGDTTIRFNPDSSISIGPDVPKPNLGVFYGQDYNPTTGLYQLGINSDFGLWPGDLVNGASVLSVQYTLENSSLRAVCEVSNGPS